MHVVVELTPRMGGHEWFATELLPGFMQKCVDLVKYDKDQGEDSWEMLPVARLS